MANRFELFHLSCLPRFPGSLFPPNETREQWLRKVFTNRLAFQNYGSDFHYVPASYSSIDGAIGGRVGRHVVRNENLPPSEGLEDIEHPTWLASVIVLDPAESNGEGQRLAVQEVSDVGRPSALVKAMVKAINDQNEQSDYFLEFSQIVDPQSFWEFIKENENSITSVKFDFIPPNMLGAEEEFMDDMRKFRDKEKAQKVTLGINNKDGKIDAFTDRIRNAVSYATQGGGAIRASAKNGKRYNSKDSVKRSYMDDVLETGEELVKVSLKFAKKVLGRE